MCERRIITFGPVTCQCCGTIWPRVSGFESDANRPCLFCPACSPSIPTPWSYLMNTLLEAVTLILGVAVIYFLSIIFWALDAPGISQ